MFPLPLHIWFEIAAFIASVICWNSLKKTHLRWFLPFLFLIVAVEITGRVFSRILHQPNSWLYNLSIPFEYLFYTFIFLSYYKKQYNRHLARLFMYLFLGFVVINLGYVQGISRFNTNTLKIGSFFMVVFSISYFIELYNIHEEQVLLRNAMFWIATGILLFNAGEFSYNLFSKHLISNNLDKTLKLFQVVNHKLNLFLYSSFIIAFICQRTTEISRKA